MSHRHRVASGEFSSATESKIPDNGLWYHTVIRLGRFNFYFSRFHFHFTKFFRLLLSLCLSIQYPMLARRSLVYIAVIFFCLLSLQLIANNTALYSSGFTDTYSKSTNDDTTISIRPGALPSYTGWARPETTMAPFFRITNFPTVAIADTDVTLRLVCEGSPRCSSRSPSFYVRAYGPSVITGKVTKVAGSAHQYEVKFRPIDPGSYHVEVILTFSNMPDLRLFPLPNEESYRNFLYEGYPVSGSPFQLTIRGKSSPDPEDLPLCRPEQLLDNTGNAGRARWRVMDAVNHKKYQRSSSLIHQNVTLDGYQESYNSLGVMMDYQFKGCRLMPEPTTKVNLFQCVREPIHIIMIGDSTFRLQEKIIQLYAAFNPMIRVSFVELYGGYFRTQVLTGPNVRQFLAEAVKGDERRVVLFNTGLHDIHRLCGGNEMFQDRQTYLRTDMPSSCVDLYKIAIETLTEDIMKLPETDVKIFQTTTAAWPKYGNYGIAWDPRYGQALPLDISAVEYFNEVAISTLKKYSSIKIVDGFHVSHARPDHREIDAKSATGRKLSHPGVEVISAMVRMWSMLFLQQVCH